MEPRSIDIFNLDLQVVRSLAPRLDTWRVTPPSMPYWRLWWNADPGASVIWNAKTIILNKDSVVIVAPHTAFTPILEQPIRRHLYIHFLIGVSRSRIADRIWSITPAPHVQTLLKCLAARLPLDPRTGVAEPWLAASVVAAVLDEFKDADWPAPITDLRVQQALAEIERNPGKGCSNTALADRVSMSVGGMVRLFVRHVGMTPMCYLERRRIETACYLLNRTTATMEAIADRCGYCDRSYFTTAFKRAIGMSPAAYRRVSQ